jgi:hypothetical protein
VSERKRGRGRKRREREKEVEREREGERERERERTKEGNYLKFFMFNYVGSSYSGNFTGINITYITYSYVM